MSDPETDLAISEEYDKKPHSLYYSADGVKLSDKPMLQFNGGDTKCVMRITRDGIWVDPDLEVNYATAKLLEALDQQIKYMLKCEREKCADLAEGYAETTSSLDKAAMIAEAIRRME